MIIQPMDSFLTSGLRNQHTDHFIAGRISAGAQNSAAAMRRLAGKGKLTSGLVELGSPADQFLNPFRPFFHQHTHRLSPTEPMAGLERVGQMNGHIVLFAHRYRDAALRINRTALERMAFRQHNDAAVRGSIRWRREARRLRCR